MAVIDKLPGIEVTVICDGRPLQEFDCEENELQPTSSKKTVTKYIESRSDKEFKIRLHMGRPFVPPQTYSFITSAKHITGNSNYGGAEGATALTLSSGLNHLITGARSYVNGCEATRSYRFAKVDTVEDTSPSRVKKDMEMAKDLGTIEVKFWRKAAGVSEPMYVWGTTVSGETLAKEVSEKALKGRTVSHATSFGPEVLQRSRLTTVNSAFLDAKEHPFCVFKFIYKSRSALQGVLIIPRSPSPDEFEELSAEEIQRLARVQFQEQRARKEDKNIKKEVKQEPGIKHESGARPKRRLQPADDLEVVDLTGGGEGEAERPRKKITVDLTEDSD